MRMLRVVKQALNAMMENKIRTFLMMLGVIIGVATLTLIASSVVGARADVMGKVERWGLDQIMIMAGAGRKPGVPQPIPTTLRVEDAQAMMSEIENVKDVSPQINRRDFPAKYGNKSTYGVLVAANPNWSSVWSTTAENGRFLSQDDSSKLARVVVIGKTIQKDLFEDEDPVGKQIILGTNPFEVIGVLEPRGTAAVGVDMDSRMVIPLSTGQKRVFNQDYLLMIKVVFHDASQMTDSVEDVRALLRERHNLQAGVEDDFTIVTPTHVMNIASKLSSTFSIFLVLVSGISLIVGAIVIANIMFIAVNERRSEIGIRRAIGARKRDILLQFLFESVSVAAIGGIIGIILGLTGLKLLSGVMKMPSAILWQPIVLALVSAIIVGLLAGIQPAKKAANLNPIDALR
ncbi:ABC transporter permease [Desulfomonile tiedjei]|uniref:ABC-type antimicrobial peptide transport system, permease component n=1 Tax=Desulfomonile tiedjei (strain ATCC 49306 / DSM 6799 / DCB-1) TaxID=706587 RepID=I4CEU7_DESTA|nr:ABC transporter permease [Desulfomonile tiedjei]AFM28088.1 ABC-type antimicrobial peptide transport system, permease component [Desulfomonile tiedjei DSM 6799]